MKKKNRIWVIEVLLNKTWYFNTTPIFTTRKKSARVRKIYCQRYPKRKYRVVAYKRVEKK